MPDWKNRIVGLTYEDPASLLANPRNPKFHPQTQQTVLRQALDHIGWIGVTIQNDTTGYLIDGHDRVQNAISTGQSTVPVLHVALDEDEEDFALATFDPIGYLAVKDQERTDELLKNIRTGNTELDEFLESLKSQGSVGPTEFPTYDENIPTEHTCPKCGYRWSGTTRTDDDDE